MEEKIAKIQKQLDDADEQHKLNICKIKNSLSELKKVELEQVPQEFRDNYKEQLCKQENEMKLLYENKMRTLVAQAEHENKAKIMADERLEQAQIKIRDLENTIDALKTRNTDLNNSWECERTRYTEQIIRLESEITRMPEKMAQQLLKEYEDMEEVFDRCGKPNYSYFTLKLYHRMLKAKKTRFKYMLKHLNNNCSACIDVTSPSQHTLLKGKVRTKYILIKDKNGRTLIARLVREDLQIIPIGFQGKFETRQQGKKKKKEQTETAVN